MQYIHPTAQIHPTALIDYERVSIGEGTIIEAYVTIGFPPEDNKCDRKEYGTVTIGKNCIIHKHANIDSGSKGGDTFIGDNTRIMAHSHVGHDVVIGNGCTLSSGCIIGGHTKINDNVNIGLNVSTHQRTHIKSGSIIGAQGFAKGELEGGRKFVGVPAKDIGPNIRKK